MKNPYCTVDKLGFPRFDGIFNDNFNGNNKKSISAPIGTPEREYRSYGRKILEKKKSIYKILGIEE
ncbi:hypothetical protein [Xenorhabdus bovienii]|uniref:hypothetical protein n=1 Tax=Xenorhabdus bovienii TaxID=40576 RepID=UPI003DA32A6D